MLVDIFYLDKSGINTEDQLLNKTWDLKVLAVKSKLRSQKLLLLPELLTVKYLVYHN